MLLEYGVSLDVNLLALSALSLAFTPRSLRLHILILQKVQVQELNGRYFHTVPSSEFAAN